MDKRSIDKKRFWLKFEGLSQMHFEWDETRHLRKSSTVICELLTEKHKQQESRRKSFVCWICLICCESFLINEEGDGLKGEQLRGGGLGPWLGGCRVVEQGVFRRRQEASPVRHRGFPELVSVGRGFRKIRRPKGTSLHTRRFNFSFLPRAGTGLSRSSKARAQIFQKLAGLFLQHDKVRSFYAPICLEPLFTGLWRTHQWDSTDPEAFLADTRESPGSMS